jgi:rRNA maturation endonuclease Nob1
LLPVPEGRRRLAGFNAKEYVMGLGTTCGNCGTENSIEEDFCTKCGQPLTRSGEQAMKVHEDAQDTGSLLSPDTNEKNSVSTELKGDAGVVRQTLPPR